MIIMSVADRGQEHMQHILINIKNDKRREIMLLKEKYTKNNTHQAVFYHWGSMYNA